MTVNPERINIHKAESDVRKFMDRHLERLVEKAREYPPAPSEGGYQRTNRLKLGWRVSPAKFSGNSVNGYIYNTASDRSSGRRYMTYVQGRQQTSLHASTGWNRMDAIAAESRNAYRAGLQEIYRRNIRVGA